MDGPSPPQSPTPKSIMRRPTYRRGSTDYHAPAPPPRRKSEPLRLTERRGSAPSHIAMPARPPLGPTRRSTFRSVAFSESSDIEMLPVTALSPRTPTYPLLRTPDEPKAKIFGWPTAFRPLYLLAAGNAGLTLFSMGEVLIQRAIWPVQKYDGLNPQGPTVIPGGTPGHGDAFGGKTGGIIAGSVFMALGIGAAVGSSVMLMRDGRRLNRAQNPHQPNYSRTMNYFAAHQVGIAILVTHKFLIEAYRTNLPPSVAWATALPGGFAQSLFAVTQAQSFSSSELANGRMPIRHRGAVTGAARAMVASYIILGAMVGTPNVSAYGREAIRMVTAISTNFSYAMPLTTARLAGPAADIPTGAPRYRGDWSAMQAFVLYIFARLSGTISSFWLARSRWPAAPIASSPGSVKHEPTGSSTGNFFRNLPPPLPSVAPDWDETIASSILMVISFGAAVYAFSQFHRDSAEPYTRGRILVACATMSVALGLLFRAMQERSKNHADFELLWYATIPGFVAQALAFYSIVELFSQSEQSRGNVPIPYRYQVIEACRFVGGLSWYLWSAMGGILGFPPIARQMTIWAATSATILGFALPNADTLRAARGHTPGTEILNPFDA